MSISKSSYEVYLEIGHKKVFAVALAWPGWCRFGKDEQSAIKILVNAAPRYSRIAKHAGFEFIIPNTTSLIDTIARLEGNTTTDFGAPDIELQTDWDVVCPEQMERYRKLLKACWIEFDRAIIKAKGKELQKGPRGGGRDISKIIDHVVGAEEGYLKILGWKTQSIKMEPIDIRKDRIRSEVIRGLEATVNGRLPRKGPRGGKRWSPRYFVRRLAWHVVDHAWEIEDRIIA